MATRSRLFNVFVPGLNRGGVAGTMLAVEAESAEDAAADVEGTYNIAAPVQVFGDVVATGNTVEVEVVTQEGLEAEAQTTGQKAR